MRNLIVICLFLVACAPKPELINNFGDDAIIHIYDLQDKRDSEALVPFLKAKKENHRIAAALAFASTRDSIGIPFLSQMLQTDQKSSCRKAAAYALGQIGNSSALKILKPAFDSEMTKENQRYILESIGKCGDSSTITLFENVGYNDSLLTVGWVYGVFRLSQKGLTSDKLKSRMIHYLRSETHSHEKVLVSHYLYRYFRVNPNADKREVESLLNIEKVKSVRDRLSMIFEKPDKQPISQNEYGYEMSYGGSYKMVGLIERLSNDDNWAVPSLKSIAFNDTMAKELRTAALGKYFKIENNVEKWDNVLKALKSEDMALQSLACYQIHKIGMPKHVPQLRAVWNDMLVECERIKDELQLPRQAETYIDVCKAIEKLSGKQFEGYKPEYNHEIDWEYVKAIPEKQQVVVKTNKGDITIVLFVNDAPGSVANFLKLVDSSFYNGKYFHRVVPHFVIQAGCPRGDGWGSLDWTQRSEFSNYQNYSEGTVGLASAGNDTEGVQWFITHCPTPHLDGRYTIFARVTEGMDVVKSIGVGDKIEEVKRVD